MRKIIPVILVAVLACGFFTVTSHAVGEIPSTQDGVRNYYLDIDKPDLFEMGDKVMNDLANILFSLVANLGYMLVTLFIWAMGQNLASAFGSQIDGILSAMKTGIFDEFFIFGFCMPSILLIQKMIKRNTIGVGVEILKLLFIILLAFFVSQNASRTLTAATKTTIGIAETALVTIAGGGDGITAQDYASATANTLWKDLVHDKWKHLEFSGNYTTDTEAQQFLDADPGYDARKGLINAYRDSHGKGFETSLGITRISYILVYFIPFLVKCAIFIIVAVISLGYQLMALFPVLLSPLILLMALFPVFGGTNLIAIWFRKIMETQLMIVIITLLLGVIIRSNDFFISAGNADNSNLAVILIQAIISVFVIVNYRKMFSTLGKIDNAVSRPQMLKYSLSNITPSRVLGQGISNLSSSFRMNLDSNRTHTMKMTKSGLFKNSESKENMFKKYDNVSANGGRRSKTTQIENTKDIDPVKQNFTPQPPQIMPDSRYREKSVNTVSATEPPQNINENTDIEKTCARPVSTARIPNMHAQTKQKNVASDQMMKKPDVQPRPASAYNAENPPAQRCSTATSIMKKRKMQEQTEMETAETQTTKKLHPISPKIRQDTEELCEAHTESPPYQESYLKQSAVTVQPQPPKQHHQEVRFVSDTEVAQTNVSSNAPPKATSIMKKRKMQEQTEMENAGTNGNGNCGNSDHKKIAPHFPKNAATHG